MKKNMCSPIATIYRPRTGLLSIRAAEVYEDHVSYVYGDQSRLDAEHHELFPLVILRAVWDRANDVCRPTSIATRTPDVARAIKQAQQAL